MTAKYFGVDEFAQGVGPADAAITVSTSSTGLPIEFVIQDGQGVNQQRAEAAAKRLARYFSGSEASPGDVAL